ncbi:MULTISPECIES: ClpXP adapter SpxH family protein [unclassified Psychrobacillus]|uniref:ClpXP adapter SpxH family protein n=1 Tax=unclassified Psychrobacillus TaxID=2636677 RepID=UPI002495BF9D|nr:ClpXP adapter SpxH family protein [Psychrobacillus sp. NEAU-3TGS]MDI2589657.1 ClpXP adapter SpxH family protein [Psychrobacillus sp. NEAU-3TGS]
MTRILIPTEPITSPLVNKPLEMYVFLDPLCSACWEMQPIIRKLQVQYGQYFTIRTVLSTQLNNLNTVCNTSKEEKKQIHCEFPDIEHSVFPSIAVKAAEFQGKKAALRFFNKIQEYLFIKTKNVTSLSVLQEIASKVNIDVEEFTQDFKSRECARSFQSDLSITSEMDVTTFPSIVFFNENIEDEGIKVSGIYPYEIYVQILQEMLYEIPEVQQPPALEKLFDRFHSLTTNEIASYYNISEQQAERELKKLLLLQKVERLVLPDVVIWRLKNN